MSTKPNIIFILIDDMGWRDLACYGSTFYETPNIDRLAREGMRFTNAYAACPVCSPTRASLLTGKYPARVGITDWIDWGGAWHPLKGRLIEAPYLKGLPSTETTVAATLRDGGYETWHVGKWHLGGPGQYPTDHGFDVNVGGCEWGCPHKGYFSPWGIPVMEDAAPGTYLTDHITDNAVRLIRQSGRQPFFLNLWHYGLHTPTQAPQKLIDKYEAKARSLGLDKMQALQEGEPFPTDRKKHECVTRRLIQSNPIYAAMVENLDWNIGRVLHALEDADKAHDTLVVFTSDNGGLSTSEGSPTCNLPLHEGKGWMYEGGTREPFLVRWPGHVQPGAICSTPITSPDLYPTLLDVANMPLYPQQHVDGVSFMPLLHNNPDFDRGPIFWHYPHYGNQGGTPGSSIRFGDWKLLEFFEDGHMELYNLAEDLSETRNMAGEHPDIVRDLHRRLITWRQDVNALYPQPNKESP